MTHRIKPLVWEQNGDFSFLGRGFAGYTTSIYHREDGRFKIDFHGIGVARPTLADAKELLEGEYQEWLSAALEPTDPLADAMKLPEIRVLVDAAKDMRRQFSPFPSPDTERWREQHEACEAMDFALAALTKEGK